MAGLAAVLAATGSAGTSLRCTIEPVSNGAWTIGDLATEDVDQDGTVDVDGRDERAARL
ncbi:MAG TPA: hypothetical protein VNJ46_03660 [Gaiellaceae bacterium]|nr:hypothetical protein [Gaiellaceae bacterium]